MNKTVTTSNLPEPFDWNANFKWISGCITFLLGYGYYIIQYFKHRAKDKEEFIVNVVKETVKVTLSSELQSIKEDVKKLFDLREADRTHFDEKFSGVMRELKSK